MKTKLLIPFLFLFVITFTYGQDTIMHADYFLPEKFSKPIKWEEAENRNAIDEQFYCNEDSIKIKNYKDAFYIIDTEKNFCRLYCACKWCKDNYAAAFPYLLIRLTDTTTIDLFSLYITDRIEYYIKNTMIYCIENPMIIGEKTEIYIDEDLFTIAGRASWILNEITGENFAIVQPFTSSEKLEQFKQKWINWIKTLK